MTSENIIVVTKKKKIPWNKGMKGYHSGKDNLNYGKKLSIETRKKMSLSRTGKKRGPCSDETKRKISESHKGKKASSETRKKLSELRKGENNPNFGKHHTEETKKKISNANKGKNNGMYGKKRPEFSKMMSGSNNPHYGKPFPKTFSKKYVNKCNGNEIWLRSSWEYLVAEYLYDNCIIYEYESTTFDLGNSTYTPDFYLVSENKYIEVKGYMFPDAKRKIDLFLSLYPNISYEIWNKEKLSELGILE